MINKVLFSSKSDEWETPQDLFNELDKEFKFSLDPCATEKNAKCKVFYTKKDNGLVRGWHNHTVFCNPPYSQIAKWVEKAYGETDGDFFTKVIMLIPVRTDTKWFHKYIYNNEFCEIRFIKGRLKFGNSKNSAPFPSMVVIFN